MYKSILLVVIITVLKQWICVILSLKQKTCWSIFITAIEKLSYFSLGLINRFNQASITNLEVTPNTEIDSVLEKDIFFITIIDSRIEKLKNNWKFILLKIEFDFSRNRCRVMKARVRRDCLVHGTRGCFSCSSKAHRKTKTNTKRHIYKEK